MIRRHHTIKTKTLKQKKPLSTRLGRGLIFATAFIMVVATPIQLTQKASADQFDTKMAALQQQIDSYQAQANTLNTQVKTLQGAVDALQAQIDAVQAQIKLNQTKYDQLTQQIADTVQKIADNKNALGETLANLYVDGSVSPIEMLASSKNISDYLNKQEYQSSIRDQLASTIKTITDLEQQLQQQQTDVKAVLDQQDAQKAQLAAQQQQQADLLTQTQGQEASYQQLVANTQQQLSSAAAEQRAYYASLGGGASSGVSGAFQWANLSPSNGAGGCSGGYAYCQPQDSTVDPWGLYNRECVSYVAWSISVRFNKYVGNFSGQGNAYQWPSSAPLYSGAVRVYNPQPGDAVILPQSGSFAPIGHAMVVESVDSNTGWIHVSQFNFYGTGQYSTMDIKSSGVIFLRFPSK